MLLNLSPSTEAASEWMGELGLLTKEGTSAFYDATGSLKPLSEIAELLKTKLAGLTDEQRQLAMKTMFGTDAIRAANILYKEGAAGVEKMFGEMGKVTAVDVMTERMNNTAGAVEELSGAFETLMISLGSTLLPLIKSAATTLQKLVGWFNGLSDGTKKFIVYGALAATLFSLILGPILILVSMIPAITTGFAAIASVMGLTAGALAGFLGIGALIVAAIGAVAVAFVIAYKKVDWFRNAVDGAWAYLKESFNTAVKIFKAIADGDWAKAWELFKSHVDKSVTAIKDFISQKFTEIKPIILAKLAEWKDAIVAWFTDRIADINAKLTEWGNAISGWFSQKVTDIKAKLDEWKTAIVDWFTSLPGVIKEKLAEWGAAIVQWTKEQNEENKRQFDEWKKSISDWFASIPGMIREKFEEWITALGNKFTEGKTTIDNKLKEWGTSISTWFTNMPSSIGKWFDGWKNNMADKFEETKETIKTKLEGWFTTIKTWFTALPEKPEIKNAGQNMVNKMSEGNNEKKQEFMDKLGKIVVDVALGALAFAAVVLVSTGREIIKRVIDGIKEIDLRETGKDVIRGLINGMDSMINGVIEKAKSIASAAKDAITGLLDINSPSRVMMELGEFTGQGFVKGIGSMVEDVRGISAEMASASVPNVGRVNAAGASAGNTTNTSNNVYNVTISAKDVREFNDVVRVFNTIQQASKAR